MLKRKINAIYSVYALIFFSTPHIMEEMCIFAHYMICCDYGKEYNGD